MKELRKLLYICMTFIIVMALPVRGEENTVINGNSVNCGIANRDGEWLFYSNLNEDGQLYKYNKEIEVNESICEDKFVKNINTYGAWVYYISCEYGIGKYKGGSLFRIKKDGTKRENLGIKLSDMSIYKEFLFGISDGDIIKINAKNGEVSKIKLQNRKIRAISNIIVTEEYLFFKGRYENEREERIFRRDKHSPLGDGVKEIVWGQTLDRGDKFFVYDEKIYLLKDKMLYSMNIDGGNFEYPVGEGVIADLNVYDGILYFVELTDIYSEIGEVKKFDIEKERIVDEEPLIIYTRENQLGINIEGDNIFSGRYYKDYFGSKDGNGIVVKGIYRGCFKEGAMCILGEEDFRLRVQNYEELIHAVRKNKGVNIEDKKIRRSYLIAKFLVSVMFKEDMSELEKEKRIHDFILRRAVYDMEGYENDNIHEDSTTPYGLLVNGKGVCTAYASTVDLMMNLAGVKSHTVKGHSKDEGHVWNLVNIDGIWYHLDVTWNDYIKERGGDGYKYFNLTEDEIRKDHDF